MTRLPAGTSKGPGLSGRPIPRARGGPLGRGTAEWERFMEHKKDSGAMHLITYPPDSLESLALGNDKKRRSM